MSATATPIGVKFSVVVECQWMCSFLTAHQHKKAI